MRKFLLFFSMLGILISACGPTRSPGNYLDPQQISEPTIMEFIPVYEDQVERVNNCDGNNPTYTISYNTIESQNASFEVSVGAGGLIQGTPIPEILQVQLEAKIAAALKKDYGIVTEKNHEITLQNPPNSNLMHTITWKVIKIKGLIDVIYENGTAQVIFDKIANVELYDRTSKAISDCSSFESPITVPTNTATVITSPENSQTLRQELTFVVDANSSWQDTNVAINSGDHIQITYVSGEWTGKSADRGMSGPDFGYEPLTSEDCYPIKYEGSSLVGMIGNNNPFKVGYEFKGQTQGTGKLFLRMNDCDRYLGDNAGSITVAIKLYR